MNHAVLTEAQQRRLEAIRVRADKVIDQAGDSLGGFYRDLMLDACGRINEDLDAISELAPEDFGWSYSIGQVFKKTVELAGYIHLTKEGI